MSAVLPARLHRKLKVRAVEAGMSASDVLLADLWKIAERPTPAELRARQEARPAITLREPAATVELLLGTSRGFVVAERIFGPSETLHLPELLDLEVALDLRR